MRKVRPTTGWPVTAEAQNAVGWNCTNSMFAMLAWALAAIAIPSPVTTLGFVVLGYTYIAAEHKNQFDHHCTAVVVHTALVHFV